MFTHMNGMVDVGDKRTTARTATASGLIRLPKRIADAMFDHSMTLNAKGDIVGTARIAGTMAAKRTHDLIPLCHQIPISSVSVDIFREADEAVRVRATVKATYTTGVEMEALTAVSVAGLTVYDMTKSALKGTSDKIILTDILMEEKFGGSSSVTKNSMSSRIKIDQSALLGEGTYGRVFKGVDTVSNEPVAVKRAKVELRTAGGVHFTTIREIKIMKNLNHPNLMNLVDIFNEEGDSEEMTSVSLVMPFMQTDLGSVFGDRSIVFTMSHVKGIISQILAGLHHMHSRWFIHRDLKPANVFMDTSTGVCKIGDFGFARNFATPHSGIHNRKRPFGGQMTPVVVTQWYRCPELFFGSTYYGPGVDIWATGCILCEMLPRRKTKDGKEVSVSRGPLFDATNDVEQLQKIFELMGTPSDDVWPQAKLLPKHIVFTHLPPPPVAWPETTFPESCQAASGTAAFIQGLLALDPNDRVTAQEAQESEYLRTVSPPPASERVIASLVQSRLKATFS